MKFSIEINISTVRRVFFAVILLLFLLPMSAFSVEVVASLDKNAGTIEDTFILTVSVKGVQKAQAPQLPSLPEFRIMSRGSSSRVNITNGRVEASIDHNYLLLPQKVGAFTIGPCRVGIKGKYYQSTPLRITVLPSDTATSPKKEDALFVTAEVDSEKAYVDEQLTYTFRFFRKVGIANASLNESEYDGFWMEELGPQRDFSRVINGVNYKVTELKRALFPLRSGLLTIEPASLTCDVIVKKRGQRSMFDSFFDDSFFGLRQTRRKVLRTQPLNISVLPLPESGRPESFTGEVGRFNISSRIDETQLRVGDSATLTVTVQGVGSLRNFKSPIPETIEGVKLYQDQPAFQLSRHGDEIVSSKTFKSALVPVNEGEIVIPPLEIPYFDPGARIYKSARTKVIRLSILPSLKDEELKVVSPLSPTPRKRGIRLLGRDILPIHTQRFCLKNQNYSPQSHLPTFLLLFLPVLGYVALKTVVRRRESIMRDRAALRSRRAYKTAKAGVGRISRMEGRNEAEFCRSLSRTMRSYLGDKLDIAGEALTPQEVSGFLAKGGLPEKLVRETVLLLEEFDRACFTTGTESLPRESELIHKAQRLLKALEKEF